VGRGVKEEILRTFRAKLNEIPGINIPEEVIKLGKFPPLRLRLSRRQVV
jgi:hypothetical protein